MLGWWWAGVALANPRLVAHAAVARGFDWAMVWSSSPAPLRWLGWIDESSAGDGVPEVLGWRKDAILRCGLADEDPFSALVVVDDVAGLWEVQVLKSPSEAASDCLARVLEAIPLERLRPGAELVFLFETTGAAIRTWEPPNPNPPMCTSSIGGWSRTTANLPLELGASTFACAADVPLTHLALTLGPDGAVEVATDPPVACVEAAARREAAGLDRWFRGRVPEMDGPVVCRVVVPLESPDP